MNYDIGIDVGSVSAKGVVLDERGEVALELPYTRHFGLFQREASRLLDQIAAAIPTDRIRSLTFTGVNGRFLADLTGARFEVETIAQILGATKVAPGVRTIISIGGQDAALFQLTHHGEAWHLENFTLNGPCASGTGSFIEQQAERLASSLYGPDFDFEQEHVQKTLDDFIALGLTSSKPAPVACRCTVFTKSDMIHLQNKGEALADIIAGLHFGNAANYLSTIVSNRALLPPIIFIGGVASNAMQVKAFRSHYPELVVPPLHTHLGALGAALQAQRSGWTSPFEPDRLKAPGTGPAADVPRAKPLKVELTVFEDHLPSPQPPSNGGGTIDAYLGMDVGSTTTKYALVDMQGTLLHKAYVQTQGKPIEVAQAHIRNLRTLVGDRVRLLGIATTGSGRGVVGEFLGADMIIDEITAHARGAVEVDPEVDTIFEIGGQDSKYIRLDRTHPLDFDMNKVCAAGTGSFLHELANKMKINIVGQFQEMALAAEQPVNLAERCTVFMESDLFACLQKGARTDDLIAGLCYATVHNYLNRVVGKRAVGKRVMFLGGPSLNKGVVAAFEQILGRGLILPPHREVMGARGAALFMADAVRRGLRTQEQSLDRLAERDVRYTESICRAERECHNECKLKIYNFDGRKSVWGGECGRYEGGGASTPAAVDLFAERQKIFHQALQERAVFTDAPGGSRGSGAPTVGVPLALHSLEWGVFWTHLLAELGFEVLVSPPTDQKIALRGVESMTAETCFPLKVFHGHVHHLLERADLVFMPNVISMPVAGGGRGLFCPFVESSHYIVKAALAVPEARIISPTMRLDEGDAELAARLIGALPAGRRPSQGHAERAVRRAWDRQEAFRRAILERGHAFLADLPPDEQVWVVTGRPYNLFDGRCNLKLGKQLAKLGITALPMDFLDVAAEPLDDFPNMYWGLGTRILKTARVIARTPAFHGVHLTNFGCGPDSFIEHFYRHVLGGEPSLILELDEHSAAAGLLTRLEAYRHVVGNVALKTADAGVGAAR